MKHCFALISYLAQLTFNLGVSSPAQCQGCQQKLSFLYSYPNEQVRSINWVKGSAYVPIGFLYASDDQLLRFTAAENYQDRVIWQPEEPASITIRDLSMSDTDVYLCIVLFNSGRFISDFTYLNSSAPACKPFTRKTDY